MATGKVYFELVRSDPRQSREDNVCQDCEEGDPGDGGGGSGGCVAPVLLTETHDPVLPALSHADVVHHEQVDVQAGSAGPPGAHEVSPCMLDQLDTTPPALHQGRLEGCGPLPWPGGQEGARQH